MSTLYVTNKQTIGCAATVALLCIASIVSPEMYPNSNGPRLAGVRAYNLRTVGLHLIRFQCVPM